MLSCAESQVFQRGRRADGLPRAGDGGRRAVTVRLGWPPGDAAPAFREAESIDSLGVAHPIPESALPPEDWFSIAATVADDGLTDVRRRDRVLSGYFAES